MASVRSTIELAITGTTRGLGAAAAEARAMAERIEAAEDRVSAARTRSAAAEARVAEAERNLNTARASEEAALSRVGVAETTLAQTRERNEGVTTRLARAQQDLDRVRANSAASAEDIARAEGNVTRVRQEADTAAAALQRAEANLASARANAGRSSAAVADAEERVRRARANAVRDSEALARAENDLNIIRRNGTRDTERQRDGILGVFDALSHLRDTFTGANDAATGFLSKLGALQNVFSTIGGPIIQTVTGILQIVAAMQLWVEIVGVVGGLIGQVLGAAVPVLFALAAAAGTAALGMDGIKKAAEVAAPAFDRLKAAVSDVFTRQLTPAFQQLAKAIPQVTAGFKGIALALSGLIGNVIRFVTSWEGMRRVQDILSGTEAFVRGLSKGVLDLVTGMLRAADVGAPAFARLGQAIGSIGTQLGDVFSRLAADGTIGRALDGFSATVTGLAAVIGPLVELFIRMGAALGNSVGVALQDVGAGIRDVTPFFVKLADVAGKILVDAFNQLGPPLRELIDSILPTAGDSLGGFAKIMHNNVLPTIAGFINFIRTEAGPAIIDFVLQMQINLANAAVGVATAVDGILAALQGVFTVLATIPGPMQAQWAAAAASVATARQKVEEFKASAEQIRDKTVTFTANVPSDKNVGEVGILGVAAAMDSVHDKTVTTTANVPSGPTTGTLGNQVLEGAIGAVLDKTTVTTSSVPGGPLQGTEGNLALVHAIAGVDDKTTTTTGNVPGGPTLGTEGNQRLTGAINDVNSKTVDVTANVNGTSAVQELVGWIGRVVGKTIDIVANVVGPGAGILGFASGGQAPGGVPILVGEHGPELIMLPRGGGFVNDATQTRQILDSSRPTASLPASAQSAPAVAAEAPITVNVMISRDEIAGIADAEIIRNNRSTKRTVLAGSGVTF